MLMCSHLIGVISVRKSQVSNQSLLCVPQVNTRCDLVQSSNNVLVIGAGSFIGARLVLRLHKKYYVHSTGSHHDIHEDQLLWYRLDQLLANNIDLYWVNYTNYTNTRSLLDGGHFTDIYYITSEYSRHSVKSWGDHLKEFVILLEAIKEVSPCSRLVLISPQGWDDNKGRIWLRTFELTASTYHSLYKIPFVSVRLSDVYGPWASVGDMMTKSSTCWYVNNVVNTMVTHLSTNRTCSKLELNCKNVVEKEMGLQYYKSWLHDFTRPRVRYYDVIFTSYFSTEVDPQRKRHKHPNRFSYIKSWFLSLQKHHLKAVIFHDGLDQGFMDRLTHVYNNVTFHKVSTLHNRSTNDARFYVYSDYLKHHPDIRRVLLTDISDVVFQRNPFDFMDIVGDYLYVGTDIDIFPDMKAMPWLSSRLANCFGNHSVLHGEIFEMLRLAIVYNAGVIGGSRHIMRASLTRITWALDYTPPQLNCNMPAVNYVIHKYFNNITYTGFPFTSRFLRRQSSPKAVYIVHK